MSMIQAVSYLRNTVALLIDVHTSITHLTSGILCLKENADELYEYLRIVS